MSMNPLAAIILGTSMIGAALLLRQSCEDVMQGVSGDMGIDEIAAHHGLAFGALDEEYEAGIEEELEHTGSRSLAAKIARDHLYERADYYTMLEKVERGGD